MSFKFPYGISDFETLRQEDYFYIDRTDRIPALENAGHQLLFLRPRRFGKSLLVQMLANYYDIAKKDKFESLFGNLKIAQNPTPKRNQYCVMVWDFSCVLPKPNIADIERGLYDHLNSQIIDCAERYRDLLNYEIQIKDNALFSFESLVSAIKRSGHQLYLFIDEYDSFANEVMMAQMYGNQRYEQLVYNEGLLKGVFKNIKGAANGKGLDRVFITGVSPIALADMNSSYNIVTSIYQREDFFNLCGFEEFEVAHTLQAICKEIGWSNNQYEETLTTMREFYNGYSFHPDLNAIMYNPTMTLHFFRHLAHFKKFPDDMLDYNLSMDRDRLTYAAALPHGREVIEEVLDETKDFSIPKIYNRFGLTEMLYTEQDKFALASLLYYLGVLSIRGKDFIGEVILDVPNRVIQSLYVDKMRELLLPKTLKPEYQEAVKLFLTQADLQPLCEFIEQRLSSLSNRDYVNQSKSPHKFEFALKMAFMLFLYDDRLYVMDSETELERRYADLTMMIRPDTRKYPIYDFVFEFKYLSLKELNLSGEQLKNLSAEEIQNLPLVQIKFGEAETQLQFYQDKLKNKYRKLNLKTIAVVGLGFERVVWRVI